MDFHAFLATQDLDQLKVINNVVVARINALDGAMGRRSAPSTRTAMALAAFKVGDLVEFSDKRGLKHRANISSINVKTATCIEVAPSGMKWRVSPSFLRLVGADKPTTSAPSAAPAAFAPKIEAFKPTAAHAGGW